MKYEKRVTIVVALIIINGLLQGNSMGTFTSNYFVLFDGYLSLFFLMLLSLLFPLTLSYKFMSNYSLIEEMRYARKSSYYVSIIKRAMYEGAIVVGSIGFLYAIMECIFSITGISLVNEVAPAVVKNISINNTLSAILVWTIWLACAGCVFMLFVTGVACLVRNKIAALIIPSIFWYLSGFTFAVLNLAVLDFRYVISADALTNLSFQVSILQLFVIGVITIILFFIAYKRDTYET